MEIPNPLAPDELEVVAQGLDADGEAVDRALEIVRDFIAERKLILYGGLGIDYALRLHGGQIYPDGERPDFDMLSPQSVDDAYDLADILHEKGFPLAQAIPALHVQTMRVRINFVVVADISFVPPTLFDAIPYLEYSGGAGRRATNRAPVRFVHPMWQRMDQHQAFCFPFRDPPREPVFHRFGKDLKRFNLLAEQYPIDPSAGSGIELDTHRLIPLTPECAIHGDVALAALGESLTKLQADPPAVWQPELTAEPAGETTSYCLRIPAPSAGTTVDSVPESGFTLATCALNPEEVLDRLGYILVGRYRPLLDVLPGVLAGKRKPDVNAQYPMHLRLFSHPGRLLAATSVATGLPDFPTLRIVSPQYLLMQYLLGFHACLRLDYPIALSPASGADAKPASREYMARYQAVLDLINNGSERLAEITAGKSLTERAQLVDASPFGLTTQVLGEVNFGESQLVIAAGDARSSKREPSDLALRALLPPLSEFAKVPQRYNPATSKKRPTFAYEISWFRWDGGLEPPDGGMEPTGGEMEPSSSA